MGLFADMANLFIEKGVNRSTDPTDIKEFINKQMQVNSITKMAKKSIFSYPVLVSEAIVASDEDLVYAISNYLEGQYAAFTMIAMGSNPIMVGTNVRDHLMTFYTEEADTSIPTTDIKIDKNNVNNIKVSEECFNTYNRYSTEDDKGKDGKSNSSKASGFGAGNVNERVSEVVDDQGQKITVKENSSINSRIAKIEAKARNTDPTIVMVKWKSSTMNGNNDIEFPVAVKAMPRFVTSRESSLIFSRLKDNKPIATVVKLLSGELDLINDIVLQLNNAKEDNELYAKLGRHPWFRSMMERRAGRTLNGIAQFIPFLKNFVKSGENILPIATLCVTKDEIENGYSNVWGNIKGNMAGMMDKLMLLCLCVVDTTTNNVEFIMHGMQNNTIMKIDSLKKLQGDSSSSEKDMQKLLGTLIHKI